jgi:hypothetical protein
MGIKRSMIIDTSFDRLRMSGKIKGAREQR